MPAARAICASLQPPAAGAQPAILTWDTGVIAWQTISSYARTLLPNGSVSRAQLADAARLPDPAGNAGRYVQVNATGTGFDLVSLTCSATRFTQRMRARAGAGRLVVWTIGSWEDNDIVVLGRGFDGPRPSWEGRAFSTVPTSNTQVSHFESEVNQSFDAFVDARRQSGNLILTARGSQVYTWDLTVWRFRAGT